MRVIVGCEESQAVTKAFRARGHEAYSCDIVECSGGHPEWHIEDDVLNHLNDGWDLGIFHPPCTALCVSGNGTYAENCEKYHERLEAIAWTEAFWDKARKYIDNVCFENPIGVLSTCSTMGKASQYVQPWQFGHGEKKATGLWLHNLPKLVPTNIVEGREQKIWKMPPSADRKRLRSVTYQGIADAMAEQWGSEAESQDQ